uniref:histidine kinase n=1 Tax=candidate division WOR-3 bacterium TaxID=2052148 RepID=A0A7C3J6C6_UNCW3
MFKDIEKKYFWYISIRFFIVLTLPILGIFSRLRGMKVNLIPHFSILFLTLLFSFFLIILLKTKKFYTFYNYFQIIYDNLLIFGIVYFTGGSNNFFEILYFVNIIAASFFLFAKGSFLTATLSTFAYSFFVFGEYFGFIISPFRPLPQPQINLEELIIRVYIYTLSFFLVAAVSGFLSERLQARKVELFKYSAKLKDLLNHIPYSIILLDEYYKVTDFNKKSKELFEKIASNINMEEIDREVFEIVKNGERKNFIRDKKTFQVLVDKIFNENSGEIFIMVFINDITDIVEYERRLRVKDKLETIGHLSASLAHEIRNPVSNIKESARILSSELKEEDKNHPMFNILLEEVERLNSLVDQFLEYAKVKKIEPELIDLKDFVSELTMCDEKFGKVKFENFEKGFVYAERSGLKQIFINLLDNSLDAITGVDDGYVKVVYEREKGFDVLRFIDNGKGIDEDLKSKMFQPFVTNKSKGTGLGLSIVYKIVKDEHSGEIDFKSEKGYTEFILKFRRNIE